MSRCYFNTDTFECKSQCATLLLSAEQWLSSTKNQQNKPKTYQVKVTNCPLKLSLLEASWSLLPHSRPSPWPSWSSLHTQTPGWRCLAGPGVRSASWEWSHPQVPSSPRSDTPAGRRSLSADTQEQHCGVITCLCYDWLSVPRLETSCSRMLSSPPPLSTQWLRVIYRHV